MALTHLALRASKVLTSSYVASSSQALSLNPYVALYCTYTRGAASGAVTLRPEFSADNGTTFWRQGALSTQAIVAGSDVLTNVQSSAYLYTSTATGAETFIIELSDAAEKDILIATHIRVSAAETGVPGTPGTLAIALCIGTRP